MIYFKFAVIFSQLSRRRKNLWPKIPASPVARLSADAGEGPLCCSAFASTDLLREIFLIFRTSSFLRFGGWDLLVLFVAACGRGVVGRCQFMVGSCWWSQFHLSLWEVADLVEFAFWWYLRRFSDRVVVCSLLILLGSGLASPRFSPAGWGSLASSEGNAFVLLYLFLVSSDSCRVCFFMKL